MKIIHANGEKSDMDEKAGEWAERTCAHCGGEGCSYCDKKGYVLVRCPPEPCRECEGDGCFVCGYTGWRKVKSRYD